MKSHSSCKILILFGYHFKDVIISKKIIKHSAFIFRNLSKSFRFIVTPHSLFLFKSEGRGHCSCHYLDFILCKILSIEWETKNDLL
jgi:hypothetical protein